MNQGLKAEIREKTGSKLAAKERKDGQLPAIVFGHKQEAVAVLLDAHEFLNELHHGHRLIDLEVGKAKEKVIVKDLQYDYLGKNIIHVDLMRVDITETIKLTVPIELRGTAKGTHESGIIEEHLDHLEIECKATDIPETIVISVKEVGVGDSIHAKDIELPMGIKLVTGDETLIVTCHLVAAAKSEEDAELMGGEEESAEPEVLTEKKEDEEGGAAESKEE